MSRHPRAGRGALLLALALCCLRQVSSAAKVPAWVKSNDGTAHVTRASASIQAPIGLVWDRVSRPNEYSLWNDRIVAETKSVTEGTPIRLGIRLGDGKDLTWSDEVISTVDHANRAIAWTRDFGFGMRSERWQVVETEGDAVVYYTAVKIPGAVGWITDMLMQKSLQTAFNEFTAALKTSSEKNHAPGVEWQPAPVALSTQWGKQVTPDNAWREYPRPQLVREQWAPLNGLWDYAIVGRQQGESGVPATPGDGAVAPPTAWEGKILVPFCPESSLSGVGRSVSPRQLLWYRRSFTIPSDAAWTGKRVMLRFEAVDWHATAWVNGKLVGVHVGGSDPFAFDVTDFLQASDNELLLRVWDPTDEGMQPRGKQQLSPEGIWYTAVTGIWQSVWLEPVPTQHLTKVLPVVTDLSNGGIKFTVAVDGKASGTSALRYRIVACADFVCMMLGEAKVGEPLQASIKDPRFWTPEDPFTYHIDVELLDESGETIDHIESYFALRTIATGKDKHGTLRLLLNGSPVFQLGPLDQGWWPDGLLTPPSDEAMAYDLQVLKRLGFNMLRKHIKVEPARYYHHCDKLGLLVWQDQPSGFATGSKGREFSEEERGQFMLELGSMMDRLEFFPSIVVWVPFNEGWGQHDTNAVLQWTKKRDPTRLVDGPSGWTDEGFGDMKDMHKYPGPSMHPVMADRVSVLGEFGGLGLPVEGHVWKDKGNWGYDTFKNQEDLRNAYGNLMQKLKPLITSGLAAAVYTQTTDVEVEVNGLMTYDRAVLKYDADQMLAWHKELFQTDGALGSGLRLGDPTWTEEDEHWLDGTTGSKAFDVKDLLPGGILGQWDTHEVDYDGQDELLKELGADWLTRKALSYSKPTFLFSLRSMSAQAIDEANKAKTSSAAEDNVPVIAWESKVLHLTNFQVGRLDGKVVHQFDDSLAKVEWTIRANKLPDGRVLFASYSEKGVTRELFAALSRDPKGQQKGPVLLYEAHFTPSKPSGDKKHFANSLWLHKSDASLATSTETRKPETFLQ